jgi:hypothetical protein
MAHAAVERRDAEECGGKDDEFRDGHAVLVGVAPRAFHYAGAEASG